MTRLVLDTNVVVSALLWGGLPRTLFEAGRAGQVFLFTSTPMLGELKDVLSRPKFREQVSALPTSIGEIVEDYAALTMVIRPLPTPRLAPDPDDDVVIGTALAAKADLLVTGDYALRSVSTFMGGRIVSVHEALRVIETG